MENEIEQAPPQISTIEKISNQLKLLVSWILIIVGALITLYSIYTFIMVVFFGGLDEMAIVGWTMVALIQIVFGIFVMVLGLSLSKLLDKYRRLISILFLITGLLFLFYFVRNSIYSLNGWETAIIWAIVGVLSIAQYWFIKKNKITLIPYITFAIIYLLTYLFAFIQPFSESFPILIGQLPNALVGIVPGLGPASTGEPQTPFHLVLKDYSRFSLAHLLIWLSFILFLGFGFLREFAKMPWLVSKKYLFVVFILLLPFIGFWVDKMTLSKISAFDKSENYLQSGQPEKIIYQNNDVNNIWLVDTKSLEKKQITNNPANVQRDRFGGYDPHISDSKLSFDQTKVALAQEVETENSTEDAQSLYIVNLQTSKQEKVPIDKKGYFTKIVWSSDSSKVAFIFEEYGDYATGNKIYLGIDDVLKNTVELLPIDNLGGIAGFSPDNQKVYGVVRTGEDSQMAGDKLVADLAEIDLKTKDVKELSAKNIFLVAGYNDISFFLTPDNKSLVYDDLIVFNLENSSQSQLPQYRKKEKYDHYNPNYWSFDLNHVAYNDKNDNLLIANSENKNLILISKQPDPTFNDIESRPKFLYWLPDNKRYVYELVDKLWIGDINGHSQELAVVETNPDL